MGGRLRLLQGQLILQQVATTSGYGDYGVVMSGFGWLWAVMVLSYYSTIRLKLAAFILKTSQQAVSIRYELFFSL